MVAIRHLGIQPYLPIWETMKQFTIDRSSSTEDEIWLLEHFPVFTQGQAGKPEHILQSSDAIPLVQSDRGGQVTYHGPGQLVAYTLLDIKRRHLGVRTLVSHLEQSLIALLATYAIDARIQCGAPGVYVGDKKIASIGLRVKNGCTYHGIALNVDMDLQPFAQINPCGYRQLKMTQMAEWISPVSMDKIKQCFVDELLTRINDEVKSTLCSKQGATS